MPTHNQDHENTEFSKNTSKNNQEFRIHLRINHIQMIEEPTLYQGHESIVKFMNLQCIIMYFFPLQPYKASKLLGLEQTIFTRLVVGHYK